MPDKTPSKRQPERRPKPEETDDDLGGLSGDFDIESALNEAIEEAQTENEQAPTFKDVVYVDNLEKDAKSEMSALLKGFKDRAAREKKRMDLVLDSEYWVCLVFQTREQKEEFLTKAEIDMDVEGDRYVDGRVVAQKLGIELESPDPVYPDVHVDRSWKDLVMDDSDPA